MDLKKINKNNLDIMFYKHIKDVVKEYDDYIYQKEQLVYLDIMHELAVEHTLDVLNVIEKSGIDEITLNDTLENGVKKSLKVHNSYVVTYQNNSNFMKFVLGDYIGSSNNVVFNDANINIFKNKDRYELHVYFGYTKPFDFYEIAIKDLEEIKARGTALTYYPKSNKQILFIDKVRRLQNKKFSEFVTPNNIKKKSTEMEYLKVILSDSVDGKEKLKIFLKEYANLKGNGKTKVFKDYNLENIYIGVMFEQNKDMFYNLALDVDNLIPMLYDYMIENIDDYIVDKDNEKQDSINTDEIFFSKDMMLSYDIPEHYEILFDIINVDIDVLSEYKKTRDIKPIVVRWFKNILNSNYTMLEISEMLRKITDHTELNFIMKGIKRESRRNPYEVTKLNISPLKKTLTTLVDGHDTVFNLLTIVLLINNNNWDDIATMTLVHNASKSSVPMVMRRISIYEEYIDDKINDKEIAYRGGKWGKDAVINLSKIIDI